MKNKVLLSWVVCSALVGCNNNDPEPDKPQSATLPVYSLDSETVLSKSTADNTYLNISISDGRYYFEDVAIDSMRLDSLVRNFAKTDSAGQSTVRVYADTESEFGLFSDLLDMVKRHGCRLLIVSI